MRTTPEIRRLVAQATPAQAVAANRKAREYHDLCHRNGIEPEPAERILREALEAAIAGDLEAPGPDDREDRYTSRSYDVYRRGSWE